MRQKPIGYITVKKEEDQDSLKIFLSNRKVFDQTLRRFRKEGYIIIDHFFGIVMCYDTESAVDWVETFFRN